MEVFVVRHAKAGSRSRWDGDDRDRPLTDNGRAQAKAIAALLGHHEIERILTSPYARCVQTVKPLAKRLGLPVEEDQRLAEGGGWAHALACVEAAAAPIVLCSHGDVIGDLMWSLERRGIPLDDDRIEKASTWALSVEDGEVTKARYLEPPA